MPAMLLAMVMLLTGCLYQPVMPRTEGTHSGTWKPLDRSKPPLYMVVGSDPEAVAAINVLLRSHGYRIIEWAEAQITLREQKMRLNYSPDDPADALIVGKVAGVDSVIFVETEVVPVMKPAIYWDIYSYRQWVSDHIITRFKVNLAIRRVSVDGGDVLWQGRAWYPRPVLYPQGIYGFLARAAIVRATCPVERGAEWDDEEWCVRPDDPLPNPSRRSY